VKNESSFLRVLLVAVTCTGLSNRSLGAARDTLKGFRVLGVRVSGFGFRARATTHTPLKRTDVITWPRLFRAFHFRNVFKGTPQRKLTDAVGKLYPHLPKIESNTSARAHLWACHRAYTLNLNGGDRRDVSECAWSHVRVNKTFHHGHVPFKFIVCVCFRAYRKLIP
jgi:hypothetical protein